MAHSLSTRIYAEPAQQPVHYHVFIRVVKRSFIFGDEEREQFRHILINLLDFCGLEAVSWCCMSNHFHILLTVPGKEHAADLRDEIYEEDLLTRMRGSFSKQYIREVQWGIEHARKEMKNEPWARDIVSRMKGQMFDLSKFMHMLKRRFYPSCVGLCG